MQYYRMMNINNGKKKNMYMYHTIFLSHDDKCEQQIDDDIFIYKKTET